MIPVVVAADLGWAALVAAMYYKAPSPRMRKLLVAVLVYVGIEVLFHVPMEEFAADCLRLLI